ncbi:MAG: DEAD/DEAH box helicase [Nitrospiraceae bacterium]|nr:MAG: DEAD/DEAH box helicase [Nitrospiraceae bacterium]
MNMSDSQKRITPPPTLLSLAPDILPQGPHPLGWSIDHLLRNKVVQTVDVVSFRTDLKALDSLGVLHSRKRTRLLLVPPNGIPHADLTILLGEPPEGLEIRQVDKNSVPELVHLKLIVLTQADGRQFAVTGSANFTTPGTSDTGNPNCELSVLFELLPASKTSAKELFDTLWDHGSRTISPDDFTSNQPADPQNEENMTLLPFQLRALEDLKKAYRGDGKGGVLLSLPTGTGKTIIAVKFLLDEVLLKEEDRVLWLAPYSELLFQAASTFKKLHRFYRFDNLAVPDENEVALNSQSEDTHVNFMTHKAAYDLGSSNRKPKVVVVDEAHWGAADYCEMLPKIKATYEGAFFLGLTGTPFRKEFSERGGLLKLFGSNSLSSDRAEIEQTRNVRGLKVLADIENELVKTGFKIGLDEKELRARELGSQALRAFNHVTRNKFIANYWNDSFGRTLVFAVNVDHANNLTREFNKVHSGVPIQVVHADPIPPNFPSKIRPSNGQCLTREDRKRIHKLFGNGKIQILVSVNIYTMGVDFPAVETLFMARPTLSPVLYSQMLGRGLRGPAFGGTESVKVIDFADQCDAHEDLMARLMTVPGERESPNHDIRRLQEVSDLLARCETSKPADARRDLEKHSGVYRVINVSSYVRANRDWKWHNDLGKAVSSGLQNKSILYSDVIHYLVESDKEKEAEIIGNLKLADEWELN